MLFPIAQFAIGLLFAVCGLVLVGLAGIELWEGVTARGIGLNERLDTVLESLAVMTVALAALELGQTIIEEEVQREVHMSAPTRVRRFLSRFMVVLVVALTIEALVLVFRYSHDEPQNMAYAGVVAFAAAALMVGWGLFVKLNTAAEALEPEGMRQAKEEDRKMR